jgi:hypothetical protein
MTTTSETKTARSHHVHANHEGDQPMKTTKKSHTQSHTSDETTKEGETAMTNETTAPAAKSKAAETAATTTTAATATKAPTGGYLQACATLLDEFDATFPSTEPLTAKDKKRTAKARKGSERYIPQLVALAQQHGVSLAAVPLDGISSASTEAAQLVPLQKQMQRLNTRLSTRVFAMQSNAWSGATKLYAVLKRLSKDDGELATGLAPVEQYFNHRSAAAKAKRPKTQKGKEALAEQKAEAVETTPAVNAAPVSDSPPPTAAASPAPVSTVAPVNGAVAHS